MPWDEVAHDPTLGAKRNSLITAAATQLAEARMIAFDRNTGSLVITDLGRIAAKYYIRHKSVEIFIKQFREKMTEADVLAMLCDSTEVNLLYKWCNNTSAHLNDCSTRFKSGKTR